MSEKNLPSLDMLNDKLIRAQKLNERLMKSRGEYSQRLEADNKTLCEQLGKLKTQLSKPRTINKRTQAKPVELTTPNNIAMLKQLTETFAVVMSYRKDFDNGVGGVDERYNELVGGIMEAMRTVVTFAVCSKENQKAETMSKKNYRKEAEPPIERTEPVPRVTSFVPSPCSCCAALRPPQTNYTRVYSVQGNIRYVKCSFCGNTWKEQ